MGPAERGHGGQPPPFGDRFADSNPFVGAGHVVCVLARREQLAEDLLEQAEVIDLASGHRGEGLVEQHHAFLDPAVVDEARTSVHERCDFEIDVASLTSDRQHALEALVLALPIGFEHPLRQVDPATLSR